MNININACVDMSVMKCTLLPRVLNSSCSLRAVNSASFILILFSDITYLFTVCQGRNLISKNSF